MKLENKFMKLNAMKWDNVPVTHDFRTGRGEEKNPTTIRGCLPLRSLRLGATASREYLQQLRAAEMTEWQLSGGDYLMSRCAALQGCH